MKVFTKISVIAKEVKTELKEYGISIIKCSNYNGGVNVVIKDIEGNEESFLSYCEKNGFKQSPFSNKVRSIASIKGDFKQYSLFKFEEL